MMQARTPTTPASSVLPDLLSSRVLGRLLLCLIFLRSMLTYSLYAYQILWNLRMQGLDTDGSPRDQRVLRGCATLPPVSTQPQADLQAG